MKKQRPIFPRNTLDYISDVLESVYRFLASLSENQEFWAEVGKFLRILFWLITLGAFVILIINMIYLLPNKRYLEIWNVVPLFSNLSRKETWLLVAGVCSAIYATIFLLVLAWRFFYAIIRFIARLIDIYIKRPVANFGKNLLAFVISSKPWTFLRGLGRMIGYKYHVYPLLPYLEPELDRRTISLDLIDQLPPRAHEERTYCEYILGRYNKFGLIGIFLFMLVFGLAIQIGSVITTPIWFLLSLLPSPLNSVLIQSLQFILVVSSIMIFLFSIMPYRERTLAWMRCLNQHLMRAYIEETAQAVGSDIDRKLQLSIERLHVQYNNDYQRTQEAKKLRDDAINGLRHLADDSSIDVNTKTSLWAVVEYTLDRRQELDAAEQKIKFHRDIVINLAINFAVAFLFFFWGKASAH